MKLLPSISLAFSFLFLMHHALSFTSCPLLGIDFPAPSNLAASTLIQNASAELLGTINNVLNTGTIDGNASSFSVEIFSSQNIGSLFTFHHSSPSLNSSVGVESVDSNSVYRIASISKLFTVYLLLIESGDVHFHDPITKYVPELLAAPKITSEDDLDFVDWESVTIGNIASQMGGIGHDYADTGELLNEEPIGFDFTQGGLPPLNLSQFPPCLLNATCTSRQEFFTGFLQRHPVFAPSTTPVYSNAAFQLLGYALEQITAKTYFDMLNDDIVTPLQLNGTTCSQPKNSSNGVIPGTYESSGWSFNLGDEGPAGGLYSSTNDMVALGRSILTSQLLKPVQTRRWLKPISHTADFSFSVGAPWEIIRIQMPSTSRVVDLYTKNGGLGAYSSEIVLVPDWNIGISILQAGSGEAFLVLLELIGEIFLPAVEEAARQEVDAAYSGHYVSTDPSLNSSITIATDETHPGLGVTSWISNGTDMFSVFAQLDEDPSPSIRVYSTGLKKTWANGSTQGSWRAVVDSNLQSNATSVIPNCLSWTSVDGVMYGTIAVDDFVFTLGSDGLAKSLDLRALRSTLQKVS